MDVELITVNTTEGAALGSALLAGVGVGVWGSVIESCQTVIHTTDHTSPNPSAVQVYQKAYPLYQGLYHSLKPTFESVGSGA
jgi:xylulokinase